MGVTQHPHASSTRTGSRDLLIADLFSLLQGDDLHVLPVQFRGLREACNKKMAVSTGRGRGEGGGRACARDNNETRGAWGGGTKTKTQRRMLTSDVSAEFLCAAIVFRRNPASASLWKPASRAAVISDMGIKAPFRAALMAICDK